MGCAPLPRGGGAFFGNVDKIIILTD